MKHSFRNKLSLIVLAIVLIVVFWACKKSTSNNTTPPNTTKHSTGWTGADDPTKVPQAVNLVGLTGSAAALPAKVDLTPYLPPIGDQGQTSTCVAWSTAYYTKTASEAIAFNYTPTQLSSADYVMSPKDMFLEIADNMKGVDCQSGTQITYALDVLVNNGVANYATVPWDAGITNCSQSQLQSSWATNAAQHKIEYYRTIPATVEGIKEQLANKNPVMIGIKVSNEYEQWSGSGVLSTATFPNPIGLHSQTIVGYDDSKGAFRIANSWTTQWGDNGFIWVEYNTLVNQYIADGNAYYMSTSSSNNNVNPPTPPPTPVANSVDVAPWVFSDVSTTSTTGDPTSRTIYLNIYNIGSNTVQSSSNWGVYYIYYNAYNANDYGIIFHDQFNTTVASNSYSCPTNDACTFNYAIPAGSDFAQVAFGTSEIYRNYNVPNITGYYYVVLIADPQNVLNDANRQNNIFYTTGQAPANVQNGHANGYDPNAGAIKDTAKNTLQVNERNLHLSRFNSGVGEHNRNAYTPQEILSFVKAKYQSGEIRQKINAMKSSGTKRLPQVHE